MVANNATVWWAELVVCGHAWRSSVAIYLCVLCTVLRSGFMDTPRNTRDDQSNTVLQKLSNDTIINTNNIIIIISGFGIYGAAVVPDSGVGNTWQRLTLVLHKFLSNGLIPSRLHIVISFLTHADHVFLGLPRFLVPGTPNRVMELMQEVLLLKQKLQHCDAAEQKGI